MKKIILLLFLTFFYTVSIFSQNNIDGENPKNNIKNLRLNNSNSWAVGGGLSNFIMHGDLRSLGTGNLGNFWNFGAYAYVDKMFNPLLGMEFKVKYSKISGGAQYFSNVYDILYVNQSKISNNLFFKGTAYGAELNLILSFSNLYKTNARKWHAAGYFGAGYHQYDSTLYEKLADGSNNVLIDFGRNPVRNSVYEASSIFLSGQLGIKYRLNKRVDIEFRPSWYFNYEDHLDATISNKQDWETFFVTNIGFVVKLGKEKVFTIWGDDSEKQEPFKVVDSDKDGVLDNLDVEPKTPLGAAVYGNGRAIDSDQDGIQDYKDKCPFKPGPASNNGCPVIPEKKSPPVIKQQIALLGTSIYFQTNSSQVKDISLTVLDEIIGLMKNIPDSNFIIEGHTDNKSYPTYNLKLSQERAEAVKNYFIAAGIDSNKLKAIGYGETRPKYSNSTAGGRQLNRRVDIKPLSKIEFTQFIEPKNLINTDTTVYLNKGQSNNNTNSKVKEIQASYHIVKKGETLYSIANENNTTVKQLMHTNTLKNTILLIGQKLKIEKNKNNFHIVQKDETLYSIAVKYKLTIDQLKQLNHLKGNTIYINQELKIAADN